MFITDRKNVVSEPLSTVAAAASLLEPVVDLTMEDEDDDEEIQEQGQNVPPSHISSSEQIQSMEVDYELSPGAGNTSSLPSPEVVSQQNMSPITNSLASVSSAPASPSLSSQESKYIFSLLYIKWLMCEVSAKYLKLNEVINYWKFSCTFWITFC